MKTIADHLEDLWRPSACPSSVHQRNRTSVCQERGSETKQEVCHCRPLSGFDSETLNPTWCVLVMCLGHHDTPEGWCNWAHLWKHTEVMENHSSERSSLCVVVMKVNLNSTPECVHMYWNVVCVCFIDWGSMCWLSAVRHIDRADGHLASHTLKNTSVSLIRNKASLDDFSSSTRVSETYSLWSDAHFHFICTDQTVRRSEGTRLRLICHYSPK